MLASSPGPTQFFNVWPREEATIMYYTVSSYSCALIVTVHVHVHGG